MTGRHAAPPDELFDQRERETTGSHRADVEVPSTPDEAVPAPAKKAPVKRARKSTTSKKAGTT